VARHPQDAFFEQLLALNARVRQTLVPEQSQAATTRVSASAMRVMLSTQLQQCVNGLFNTPVAPQKPGVSGIKQVVCAGVCVY
jgi:hypothetical protein